MATTPRTRKTTPAKTDTSTESKETTVTEVATTENVITPDPAVIQRLNDARKLTAALEEASASVGTGLEVIAATLATAFAQGVPALLGEQMNDYARTHAPIIFDLAEEGKLGARFTRAFVVEYHKLTGKVIATVGWEEAKALPVSQRTLSTALEQGRAAGELPESKRAQGTKAGKAKAKTTTSPAPVVATPATDAPKVEATPAPKVEATDDELGDLTPDEAAEVHEHMVGMAGQLMADAAEVHANTAGETTPATPAYARTFRFTVSGEMAGDVLDMLATWGISVEELTPANA